MAFLPPTTVPTSFVPHPGTPGGKKMHADLAGAFAYLAYGVLVFAFVLALGVFAYGRVLDATKASKDAAIAKAVAALDATTVKGFVRLNDRLTSGAKLLENHVAVSNFFPILETTMPSTTRFLTLRIAVDDSQATKVDGTGVAKSFNALAVTSSAFAKDSRIKGAIFSNIGLNKDGSISFAFSATLDRKVISFTP